jgi:hypothetical protein
VTERPVNPKVRPSILHIKRDTTVGAEELGVEEKLECAR